MTATTYRRTAQLLVSAGHPSIVTDRGAEMPCGCRFVVGLRIDNRELAGAAMPCSDEHKPQMRHFDLLLRESLAEPRPDPLEAVAAELLDQTWRFFDREEMGDEDPPTSLQ